MTFPSRYIYALTFGITATGFLLPFWPFTVLGILVAVFSGRYWFAIGMALLIDIGSGMPTGIMWYVGLPFTALAAVAALIRVLVERYFLDKTPPSTL